MRINTNYVFCWFCFCWFFCLNFNLLLLLETGPQDLSPCYLQLCTHWSNRTIGSFTTYEHWGWELILCARVPPEHITLVMICRYLNHLNLRNHMRNTKRFWRAAEVGQFSHFSKKKQTKKNSQQLALEDRLLKVSLQEVELWFQSVASLSRKSNFYFFFFPPRSLSISDWSSIQRFRPATSNKNTNRKPHCFFFWFFCRLCINTGSFLVSKKTGLWGTWESWRYFDSATKELLQPTPQTGKRSAWRANARTHKKKT